MASRRKHRAGIPKHAILVDGDWRLPDWRDRVIAVEADDRTIAVKADNRTMRVKSRLATSKPLTINLIDVSESRRG